MSQAIKRLGRVLNFMKRSGFRGCLSLFAAPLFTEIVLERLDKDLALGHRVAQLGLLVNVLAEFTGKVSRKQDVLCNSALVALFEEIGDFLTK
jgi:hypothetical protein